MSIFFILLLTFIFSSNAKDYKGAELYSIRTVKYGKFEVRMRAACGSGIISSFFLYYDNSYLGSPEPWQEIDIEVVGKNCNAFQSNIITGTAEAKKNSEKMHSFTDNLSNDYHTYSIEWTPNYIAWFIDGKEVRRSTDAQVKECQQKEMSYRFNLWISDAVGWAGQFNPSILPKYQYINWIRYSKYTPAQGNNGTDFTVEWQEDFNSFNSSHWAKGDWSFDGNLVDFLPNNVVFKDGYCILCLTTNNATGFSGEIPKDIDTSTSSVKIRSLEQLKINKRDIFKEHQSFSFSINGRLFSENITSSNSASVLLTIINKEGKNKIRLIK